MDIESFYPRLYRLASRKIKEMSHRQKPFITSNKKDGFQHDLPTPKELVEVLIRSKGKCAISGVTGHWPIEHYLKPAPLLLVIDHIIPVSRGGSFGVGNIQVALSCINQVKGNRTDEEVRVWLEGLRKNHKKKDE
ncbi:uncharacterized protein B0P05DRAFT_568125 [Gilbertella persicaria]|uniref:HNH nuclease domain-containing protein n=1 Tax=Rhizopus stolonifer TaxID=4846 RepID=A0A367KXI2_RHIST|nr:uncharacterized protein B0P05DRAFT_568125 [Gilbertella persicaria]KAI8094892.1 hypothetical protein B0P05DRAFT_568125 [Gilbertella persicaria]RCI06895.1 hypothetical protein CU098_008193 [Rhizopus stolonifer]